MADFGPFRCYSNKITGEKIALSLPEEIGEVIVHIRNVIF